MIKAQVNVTVKKTVTSKFEIGDIVSNRPYRTKCSYSNYFIFKVGAIRVSDKGFEYFEKIAEDEGRSEEDLELVQKA